MIKLPGFKKQTGFATPIILTAALLLLAAVGAGIYYFSMQKNSPTNPSRQNQNQSQPQTSSLPAKPAENKYEGEDFSMTIPEGWDKSQQSLSGTLLTLYKTGETHTDDPNAQKINFKSYMAISFDRTQGKTKSQILDMVKQSLLQLSPTAKINTLPQETVDNQTADLIEISLAQQDVNFKVLVAVVIKGDKYFTLSANTTEKKWAGYKEGFYKALKSMILKGTPVSNLLLNNLLGNFV